MNKKIYKYKVKRNLLNKEQLKSLGKKNFVFSLFSPDEWTKLRCAVCEFPDHSNYLIDKSQIIIPTENPNPKENHYNLQRRINEILQNKVSIANKHNKANPR